MIGKSFLSCADVVWRENLFSSHAARTRATQYYNGRLRPVQEGKNLRQKTKMVNGRNVRLSFQEVGPREKTCTSINNKLKWKDNSKGNCTSPGILIQEPVKSGKAGKWRWKGDLGVIWIQKHRTWKNSGKWVDSSHMEDGCSSQERKWRLSATRKFNRGEERSDWEVWAGFKKSVQRGKHSGDHPTL